MDLRARAVKGVAWNAFGSWSTQALSFLVLMVLARLLGPEPFGTVALAGFFVAFLRAFLTLGLTEALVQRADLSAGHRDTAFFVIVLMGTLLTVLGVFSADFVARLLAQPDLAEILRAMSFLIVIAALGGVHTALIRRDLQFKTLVMRKLFATVAGAIAGVGAALSGFGIWSLVFQLLVQEGVGTTVIWFASRWRPTLAVSGDRFLEMFRFGKHVLGLNGVQVLNGKADTFLVGYLLGPVALGFYSVAKRINAMLVEFFTAPISNTALPAFSRMDGDRSRVARAYATAAEVTSVVTFPVSFGVAAVAPELVQVVLGSTWLPAVPVVQVLALAGAVSAVGPLSRAVMLSCGKPSWSFALVLTSTLSRIAVILAAFPFGIVAVAVAFTVHTYLMLPLNLILVQKLVDVRALDYLKSLASPCAAAVVMVAVIYVTRAVLGSQMAMTTLLILLIACGAVTYVAVLAVTALRLLKKSLRLVRLAAS